MRQSIRSSVRRILIPVLCLLTIFAAGAWAQGGRISGRVVAEGTREPLVGATVEVTGPTLRKKMGAVSRADGRYAVEGVPSGNYVVKVSFIGYRDAFVKGVEVASGKTVAADVQMAASPYELGQVVVSASRRAENLVDAAISISKVDEEAMNRNLIASSAAGLIRGQKGVDFNQRGILAEGYNIRGYNSAFNERMMMFVDGQPYVSPVSRTISWPMPKEDIQDIEVITGPAAVLYGPDVVSGVISVTSKDPRETRGTSLSLGGGSHRIYKSRFRQAKMHGRWGYKVSGEYQRAREFDVTQTYYNADSSASATDDPDMDAYSARGTVGIFYYPNQTSRIGVASGAGRAKFLDMLDSGRMQDDDLRRYFQQATYDSPGLRLSVYAIERDEKAVALPNKAQYRLNGLSPEEAEEKARSGSEEVLWGGEARAKFDAAFPGIRVDLGADFRQRREKSVILESGKSVASQFGLYGRSEVALGPRFRAQLAARLDFHDTYPTQLSPKLALIYKPRPEMAFRATFNSAFRNPNTIHRSVFFPILGTGMVARGNGRGFRFGLATGGPLPPEFAGGMAKLSPEENLTFELGFKGVLENRAFLDISAYRSLFRNFISPSRLIGDPGKGIFTLDEKGVPRVGESTRTYINYGRQIVYGMDVGVNVYASRRVTARGNFSFIHPGEFEKLGTLQQPFNTPELILNLGLSAVDLAAKGSSLDLSMRRVSEYYFLAGVHNGTVPAYAVLDASMGYRKGRVTYRIMVQNLLDNDHIELIDGPRIGILAVGEVQYNF